MKTSLDVIKSGFNAIRQNGELFKIVAGKDNMLYIQKDSTEEVESIEVPDVQEFVRIQ